jgi:hypothetical protein
LEGGHSHHATILFVRFFNDDSGNEPVLVTFQRGNSLFAVSDIAGVRSIRKSQANFLDDRCPYERTPEGVT